MVDMFGLEISSQMFFHIMISFAFFVGIVLMVSPEAFDALNRSLKKEYGLKTRIIPMLENTSIDVVDKFVVRNRVIAGIIIAITSFILLLIYK